VLLKGMLTSLIKEDKNAYDTKAFNAMVKRGEKFGVCHTEGLKWVEIDFKKELERARRMVENA